MSCSRLSISFEQATTDANYLSRRNRPDTSEEFPMITTTSEPSAGADPSRHFRPLPETVQLTAATIRAWREAGYRVSEQREANWVYLVALGNRESAVYKVIGPRFQGQAAVYEGCRVA
jgi:hypothetical protein